MDEKIQRAVQRGVLAPHLSTKNLFEILAQSAVSIIGAIQNRRQPILLAFP
jgi:hypothetical protein